MCSVDPRNESTVKSARYGASVQTIADELGVDFDQLKELNGLARKHGYWVANGTKLALPPPQSQQPTDKNHIPVIDVDAASAALDRGAHGKPTENCRRSVFDAIDVGLEKAGKSIRIDRNTPNHYAEESGPKLEAIGFSKIISSADELSTYTPRKGDVVVLQHYKGQGYYKDITNKDGSEKKVWADLPAGHIAMFDGKYWVSDFPQKRGSRIWGGPKFEYNRVGLAVYRP